MKHRHSLDRLVFRTLCIGVTIGLFGCSSIPARRRSWRDLYPCGATVSAAIAEETLRHQCADSVERERVVADLGEVLARPRLPFRDQYAAARVAGFLLPHAEVTHGMHALLQSAESHPDFLGMLFFSRQMYSPSYIEYACHCLRDHGTTTVRLLDHDGSLVRHPVQMGLIIARGLSRATGEDFGQDADLWIAWWRSQGTSLAFDPDEMRYSRPVSAEVKK